MYTLCFVTVGALIQPSKRIIMCTVLTRVFEHTHTICTFVAICGCADSTLQKRA